MLRGKVYIPIMATEFKFLNNAPVILPSMFSEPYKLYPPFAAGTGQ